MGKQEGIGEKLKGVAKEAAGKVTGDQDTREEGEAQQQKAQKEEEAQRHEQRAEEERKRAQGHEGKQKSSE